MHHGVGLVANLDGFAVLAVFVRVRFRVLDHSVDFVVGKSAGSLDNDLLFLTGRLVLGRDVEDTVGVDVEGDLDLRYAALRRRNLGQVETA